MRIALVNDMQLAIESLRRAVATIPDATIAWIAIDGADAVAKCAADIPDVILMDMIMPIMDGVEATRRIMKASPCPILVVTATVEGNASKVFEALGAGALDAVATPGLSRDGGVVNAEPLQQKVQMIARLKGIGSQAAPRPAPPPLARPARAIKPLIAIGASTGGPQALATVLRAIERPARWPIVIVQHIDAMFAAGLSEWLSRETSHRVVTARHDDEPAPGTLLLASSQDHLVLDASGHLRYTPEPRDMPFRPSVDVFFESLASAGAQPGIAAILTGMGRDGAAGMGTLRRAGWHTVAQDRATSVVWGMPGAAAQSGAAVEVLPIESIGPAIDARARIMMRSPGGPS